MHIVLRPIENLKDFNADEFRITPWSHGIRYTLADGFTQIFEKAKQLAQTSEKICIAIFTDDKEKTFVLSERIDDGNSIKLLLFNAKEVPEGEHSIHAISRRGDDGNPRYEAYFQFEKGSIA